MWIARKNGLNPATFLGRRRQGVPGTLGSRHHLGRGALYRILVSLRLELGDEILVPAYICDTALHPLLDRGVSCKFYRLDNCLNADLADMESAISPRTRAVIVVHYFGFPQPMPEIRAFCEERNLQLVEDCAHVLPADHRVGALGSWGDHAFFSLRKHLPIPGAAPALRAGGALQPFELNPPGTIPVLRHVAADMLASAGFPLGVRQKDHGRGRDLVSPQDRAHRMRLYQLGMHSVSRHLAERMDFHKIALRRRRNCIHLLETGPWSTAVTPLFPQLPDGIVPLWFPVRVADAEGLSRRMARVDAFVWPTLHSLVEGGEGSACQQARQLRDALLLLPMHEGLGTKELDYMSSELGRVLPS